MPTPIQLPSFSRYDFERTFREAHAAEITDATTPDKRDALNAAFRAATAAEEKRIEGERKRLAAENAAAFLADPKAVLDYLDAERGRTFDLGEMALIYGIASVTMKRGKGRGDKVGKGTLAEGTISPFVCTVRIGDRQIVTECGSRNDRHSKQGTQAFAVTRAVLDIAEEIETAELARLG